MKRTCELMSQKWSKIATAKKVLHRGDSKYGNTMKIAWLYQGAPLKRKKKGILVEYLIYHICHLIFHQILILIF